MALMSSTPQIKYDVFLSFRGTDTRNTFTSHLCKALRDKQIETFMDDKLNRGDEISPSLLSTIEESHISIVIFSKNYASSRWCLEELVKIVERWENHKQIVIPVFYKIDPSDMRNQTGSYAEAFAQHEQRFMESLDKVERVQRWKDALKQTANLSGFDSRVIKPESVLVNIIVDDVLKKLDNMSPSYNTNLPGMNSRIKEIESLLRRGDVRSLGIWGIGGIGKTTLAQEVSKRISCQFESSGFAGSIRECSKQGGLNYLRQSLLSTLLKDENAYTGTCTEKRLGRKKLLIILDDVTNFRQIKHLIGDLECLSSESRIIVTSRDKQVLQNCRVHHIYQVEELCFNDALKLFCQHAFRQNRPKVDYNELSNSAVAKVGGVPLALEVLGSALFEKTKQVWESALKKLENNFDKDIHEVLKISYDELDDNEQSIFLDIACFFKGWNIDIVKVIMDACGFFDEVGISGLIDKSLITKSRNMLTMHDLLQATGKEIVRQQSPNDPGKRTRLWCYKDIYDVLTKDKGTEMIEAISLNMAASNARDINLTPRAFAKMENLRLLNFYVNNIHYNCGNKVHVPEDLVESDFTELKYFYWYGYPLKSLQQKFHFEKLVILEMYNSNIEELWSEGVQPLYNLKKIDLSWSHRLISCPDLSRAPNLEILKLDGCTSMSEIPSSIQHLSKVESLYLTYCSSLVSIPDCTGLESLKDFFLYECSKLKRLPQLPTNLEKIYLYQCTSLVEIQSSFTCLHKVQSLQLSGYESLTSIPDLRGLKSLTELVIYNCSKLKMLPELPNNIEELTLENVPIEEFPPSSEDLDRLRLLRIDNCSMLKSLPSSVRKWKSLCRFYLINCSKIDKLPDDIGALESLKCLVLKRNNFVSIPGSIINLSKLETLDISYCERLRDLPQLPTWAHIKMNCTSLERLPYFAFRNNILERNSRLVTNFINCYNLDLDALNDVVKDAQLKIQGQAALVKQDDASEHVFLPASTIYPESKIPEWFHYQSRGSFIDVKLPPLCPNCNFLCFALCVVVAIPNPDGQCNHQAFLSHRYSKVTYDCNVKSKDGNRCVVYGHNPYLWSQMPYCGPDYMKSNHVIIGISFYIFHEICVNELSFRFNVVNASYDDEEEHFNVEMCGVHLMSDLTLSGYRITKLPDRLGDLTSLQRLVLNRNYFESIPGTIINLSKLETLDNSYCERLRDLPQLPAGTHIKAMNCTSLERSSYFAFQNDIFEKPSSLVANFINCYNLDLDTLNDVVKDIMLNIQGQATLVKKDTLPKTTLHYEQVHVPKNVLLASVIYPESKIPVWFEYQSRGSSIDVKLPTHWRNCNFLCFALCVVVAIQNRDCQCNHSDFGDHRYSKVTYDMFNYHSGRNLGSNSLEMPNCGPDYMKSNHLIIWFGYCYRKFRYSTLFFKFNVENVHYLFGSKDYKEHFKVEKCGVHLMSGLHLEESDEEDESHLKESDEEDEPHPKRLKHIE